MKHQIKTKRDQRAFSLVEILVVIAVIGVIAAIAVPSIGAIGNKAKDAKSKRNAQMLCELYTSARSVGAIFSSTDKSGIFDELIVGKTGPQLAGTSFKMSALSAEEKLAALQFCHYNASADAMEYDPSGGQEVPSESEWMVLEDNIPIWEASWRIHDYEYMIDAPWGEFGPEPSPFEYRLEILGYWNSETNSYQPDPPSITGPEGEPIFFFSEEMARILRRLK